jgi:hypothetical protein
MLYAIKNMIHNKNVNLGNFTFSLFIFFPFYNINNYFFFIFFII